MTSGAPSDNTSAGRESSSRSQRVTTLLLAILATGIMQCFRLDAQFDTWLIFAELGIVIPYVSFLYWRGRQFPGGSTQMPGRMQGLLALLVLLPILVQFVARPLTGAGDPTEIVMLLCVQNAALGAAALGQWRRAGGISFLLSGFLVLFVTAITDSRIAYVLSGLFGLTGMWWLMSAYWDRLQGRFAVETTRHVPVRTGVIAATLLVLLGGAALASLAGRSSTFVLPGFMPTSGGNRWTDQYARSGVGDGDMLVAAKDKALSVGPVDSEIFTESEMPSLYDALNDVKGKPFGKMKTNLRIAIDQEFMRDMGREAAESQQSGREFSTVRRMTRRWRDRLEDRKATAMFYVVGRTPLHLALETYDHFDGAVWSARQKDPTVPRIEMDDRGSEPWMVARRPCGYPILVDTQQHAVKIINLKTNRFPSPSQLAAWQVYQINRPDFFGWSDDGIAGMPRRDFIPQLTTVQLISHRLNLEPLRTSEPARLPLADALAHYLEVSDLVDRKRVSEAVHRWTEGVPVGWQQVEAVVEHLRADFEHDPAATAPANCEDTTSHFLTARRGPDYLFASTAAVMVRMLGYPSRVVSGFYADPRDYDRRGRQTIVEDEDAHLWVEVCVDGRTWIPIEPTPGYEPPITVLTWSQRLARSMKTVFRWVRNNVLLAVALFCAGIGLIVYRRETFDVTSYAFWSTLSLGSPRRRILWTVWLLEWRGWMAGRRRPTNRTLRQWYEPVASDAAPEESESLRILMTLADWARYRPAELSGTQWPYTDREIVHRCRSVGRSWTSRRLGRQERTKQRSLQSTPTSTNAN